MSIAEQTTETSLNKLKLRLSQLEMQLSRLAVVHGLAYGCLQELAGCFLRTKRMLLEIADQQDHNADLVDVAEALLTDVPERDLATLEDLLLRIRSYAQDPQKQHLSPGYQTLMSDLQSLENDLQSALQRALGNIAG